MKKIINKLKSLFQKPKENFEEKSSSVKPGRETSSKNVAKEVFGRTGVRDGVGQSSGRKYAINEEINESLSPIKARKNVIDNTLDKIEENYKQIGLKKRVSVIKSKSVTKNGISPKRNPVKKKTSDYKKFRKNKESKRD